jgi:hypothetical protein
MEARMWWVKALFIWALASLLVSPLIGRFVGGRRKNRDRE